MGGGLSQFRPSCWPVSPVLSELETAFHGASLSRDWADWSIAYTDCPHGCEVEEEKKKMSVDWEILE